MSKLSHPKFPSAFFLFFAFLLFLIIGVGLIPTISAGVLGGLFGDTITQDASQIQITQERNLSVNLANKTWVITKQTGNEKYFDVFFSNQKDKKTQICYVLKNGVNPLNVDLTNKQLYNRTGFILDDKNKEITLKYETAKCNVLGVMKDGYNIDLTTAQTVNVNDYIQLGNSTLILEYQDIKLINYQDNWFDLNVRLYANISNDWQTSNDIWIKTTGKTNKFGANFTNTNETTYFLYQINSTVPILKKDSFTYYLEKIETNAMGGIFTQQHKIDFGDICAVELILNESGDLIDSFNPNCNFKVYNILDKEYILNVTFYANYDSIKGIIDIDPTISVDTTSGVAGINTNTTSEGWFQHLTLNDSYLVLYLPLDTNTSLTTVYDYTTKNNDGTVTGSPDGIRWNSSGYFGGGYIINQSIKSYIRLPDLVAGQKQITVNMWFRSNVDNTSTSQTLLEQVGAGRDPILLQRNNAERYTLVIDNGTVQSTALINYDATLVDTDWHMITGLYNGTDFGSKASLYIDGSFGDDGGNIGGNITHGGAGNILVIGSDATADSSLNGTIDEVMIWNRSLSSQEILDLYRNQSSRFMTQGYLDMQNLSLGGNNENLMNITLNATLYLNSNLTIQVGFNNGTGYNYNGSLANLSLVGINDYYIWQLKNDSYFLPGDPSNMSIRIGFWSGNSTFMGYNPFYSPVLIGNFTVTTYVGGTTTTTSSTTLPHANLTLYLRNSTGVELYKNITALTNESINITSSFPYPADVNMTLYVMDYAGINQSRNISKSFLENFTTFWTTGSFLINISWEGNLTFFGNSTAFWVDVNPTTTTTSSTTLPHANLTLYLRNSTAQSSFTGLYTNITAFTNESVNITSKEPYPNDVNMTLYITDYSGINQSRNISKSFLENFTNFWTPGNYLINITWGGNLTIQPNSTAFYITVLATTTTSSTSSTLPKAYFELWLNGTKNANLTTYTNNSVNITVNSLTPADANITLFLTNYAGVNNSFNYSKSFLQNFTNFWTEGNFLANISWEGNLTYFGNSTSFYVTVIATTTTSTTTTTLPCESDPTRFCDNFNRADSTNIGTNWTTARGSLLISSNSIRGGNALNNNNFALLNSSTFLGIHNSTQKIICADKAQIVEFCGLIARYENSSNYYLLNATAYQDGITINNVTLSKVIANVTTILNVTTGMTLGVGVNLSLSLSVNGTTLYVYVNDILNITSVDTSLQNTTSFVGLFLAREDGITANSMYIDEYNASTADGTTTSSTTSTTLPRFTANITIPQHNVNLSTKNILIRANISDSATNIASVNFSLWSSNGTYRFLNQNATQSNALIWFNSSFFNVTEAGIWGVFVRLFDSAGQTTTTGFNFTVINTNPNFSSLTETPATGTSNIPVNFSVQVSANASIDSIWFMTNSNFTVNQIANSTCCGAIRATNLLGAIGWVGETFIPNINGYVTTACFNSTTATAGTNPNAYINITETIIQGANRVPSLDNQVNLGMIPGSQLGGARLTHCVNATSNVLKSLNNGTTYAILVYTDTAGDRNYSVQSQGESTAGLNRFSTLNNGSTWTTDSAILLNFNVEIAERLYQNSTILNIISQSQLASVNWIYNYSFSDNDFYTYYWFANTTDGAINFTKDYYTLLQAPDTIKPSIIEWQSPQNGSFINGPTSLKARCVDDVECITDYEMANASIETNLFDYLYLGRGSLDSGTIKDGIWSLVVNFSDPKFNQNLEYRIRVRANDSSNNQNISTNNTILIDRNSPLVNTLYSAIYCSNQSICGDQNMIRNNQIIRLKVDATDSPLLSAGINSVQVNISGLNGTSVYVNMQNVSGSYEPDQTSTNVINVTITGATSGTKLIPLNITDRSSPANENRGNNFIVVVDNDAPSSSNCGEAPSPYFANDTVTLTCDWTDNLNISSGTYWIGTNLSGSWENFSASYFTTLDGLTATSNTILNITNRTTTSYVSYATDGINNTNQSAMRSFRVYDRSEYGVPIVTLISPADQAVLVLNDITFRYNVTNVSSLSTCDLSVDNVNRGTENSPIIDVTSSFSNINVVSGNSHSWYVTCNSSLNLIGTSDTFEFNNSAPLVEVVGAGGGGAGVVTPIKVNYTVICKYLYDQIVGGNILLDSVKLNKLEEMQQGLINLNQTIFTLEIADILSNFESKCGLELPKVGIILPKNFTCIPTLNLLVRIPYTNKTIDIGYSLPFTELNFDDPSCKIINILKVFFRVERKEDNYVSTGIRVWWLISILFMLSFIFYIYVKRQARIKREKKIREEIRVQVLRGLRRR